ncbi:UNVERIFIED_CONTAM: hypothetical protein Sindi_1423000 [Sesamum indicum]
MCWRAEAEDNPRKFDRIMEEIKSLNEEPYDWLRRIDKAQWTLAHDGGWRTGILTTNMSECINGVLKGARRLPIMAIVQITLSRSVQYFLQRSTRCNRMINANQQWADFAFKLFEARQAKAVRHIVQKFDYNQQSASVVILSLTGQGSRTYVVKLKHRMCYCGNIQSYKKTYQGRFEPVYDEKYWDPVDFELVHNPTVRAHRGPGRQVSTRIPNEMDRPQVRAHQQYQARQARE